MIEIEKLRTILQELPTGRQAVLVPFLSEAVMRFAQAADKVQLADADTADFIQLLFSVELKIGDRQAEHTVRRGRFYETYPR